MDSAKTTNKKLCLETRSNIMGVKEAIDNVQHMADNLEAKSVKTAAEVTKSIRRLVLFIFLNISFHHVVYTCGKQQQTIMRCR